METVVKVQKNERLNIKTGYFFYRKRYRVDRVECPEARGDLEAKLPHNKLWISVAMSDNERKIIYGSFPKSMDWFIKTYKSSADLRHPLWNFRSCEFLLCKDCLERLKKVGIKFTLFKKAYKIYIGV